MHFDRFELCFLACFAATWQLLEGKFFKEDVFGFWAVLAVPFLGPRGSQKWDRRLQLLSFLSNSLKTVPKTGPFGSPVFGILLDAF